MTLPNTQIHSTSRREERTSSSSRSISSTTPMLPLTTGRLPPATASTWLIPIPAAHNGTSPRTHTVGLVLSSDAVKTWVNKKTLRPKTNYWVLRRIETKTWVLRTTSPVLTLSRRIVLMRPFNVMLGSTPSSQRSVVPTSKVGLF